MEDEKQVEITEFDPNKPQSAEVVFIGTGDRGYDMPDAINIKINQLTSRQILYAAINLWVKAIKEFETEDGKEDITDYLCKTFLKAELGQKMMNKLVDKKDDNK